MESLVQQLDAQEDGTVIEVRHEADQVVVLEINKGGVVREVATPNNPVFLPQTRLRPATQEDFIKYGAILQRLRDGRQ